MRHQCKEAYSLQCYCLTAGVGAGNQQHGEFITQLYVQRHYRILRQQRVTSLRNFHTAAQHQHRSYRMLLLRQQSSGADNVQRSKNFQRSQQRLRLRSHVLRELTQNTLDFLVLLCNITLDIIVQVDNSQWLDKQRCTRTALVVYNAGEVHLIFLLHRDNVTVAAHRHDIIHEILLVIGVMQYAVELFLHAVFGNLNRSKQTTELRGSVILDFAMLVNRTANLLFQTAELRQLRTVFSQIRRSFCIFRSEILHRSKGLHRCLDMLQLLRLQHTAKLRALHIGRNIKRTAKGETSAFIKNAQCFRSFLLQALNLTEFTFDLQGNYCLLAQKGCGLGGQHIFYFIKF